MYQGEGDNWKGKVIINYYNQFWTDDKGVNRYDGGAHKQTVLEYKGDPTTIHGNFSSFGSTYSRISSCWQYWKIAAPHGAKDNS
ncbi:hypothetical protein Desor_2209 [Desulfosporosinus orientis DSM 765]|uniref:Uncharacterized protein n=1 Tax=Desulfosporosinus orientis (strain ATCC 19365 / DSM 765 / NCIMB 8382 / VKM B-1628 / Singapore I) TaxID=768706 RepID=G7W8V1_DESOD|nr:hypothetical protein [Desulfosporosinus orientis]AET67811.1 hypothetical protein Desor_2209 [Desulfosporosinus orientis DSM 765]